MNSNATDLLDVPSCEIITGKEVNLPKVSSAIRPDGCFTSSSQFLNYLHNVDWYDAMTFTFDDTITCNVRRLLYCKASSTNSVQEARMVTNIHAKIYIISDGQVFVGSFNLVKPFCFDVIVRPPHTCWKHLKKTFDNIWNQAK